jgi:sarcosine oxidase subunit beta
VAWGYARQADSMGVDIIQHCEVTGFDVQNGKIEGVQTSKGNIKTKKVGLCVAGSTSLLAEKLNMKLPIETHVLQACVSEPVKPFLDHVVTFGAGHFYCSQSDKGEMVMGGDLDGYNSYAQRGNLPTLQHVLSEGVAMFPNLSRLKMLRTWGGIVDMSMDGSPIIDKTHINGLYLNCGWCYGGFKATPASGWTFAYTIAQDQVHELNSKFNLNRFNTGHLIDEKGTATKVWLG